ncbi:class A beta-lactamase-related serine hydrolase [Candidatus Gracilibacteria bacterium]|nr:class A beta-lactamase-related serine hydrolase [Candidatus Gracilibacteria bacterium]
MSGIIGVTSTMGIFILIGNPQILGADHSIRQSGYRFINPLLECEVQNKIERQKYIPFEEVAINRINEEVINKNPSVKVGVYFRNLNNGPWFGINENEYYSPASILKVPIFITYLKWAEKDPSIWNKKMPISSDSSFTHYFPPSKVLATNQEYDTKTLLEHMIKYSDNHAMGSLVKAIPTDLYSQINRDLGITVPGIKTPEDYLSVKDMATFFRILYNSSYLERESSEYALKVLSETDFNKGLRVGIPSEVLISHKFGERGYNDEATKKYVKQLHDCGIVYYEQYPYLACVVTRGDDFDINAKIIADTSRIIFEEVSKAFPRK